MDRVIIVVKGNLYGRQIKLLREIEMQYNSRDMDWKRRSFNFIEIMHN
jgi:hypothetical protein